MTSSVFYALLNCGSHFLDVISILHNLKYHLQNTATFKKRKLFMNLSNNEKKRHILT